MNYDLAQESEDSIHDVPETRTLAGIGKPNIKPVNKDLALVKRQKARELIGELKTGLSPAVKTDLNARRIIQVCIILENILEGLE